MPLIPPQDAEAPSALQVTIPDSNSRKSQLRARLRGNPHADRSRSAAVCEALQTWLDHHHDLRTIAAFAALPGEVDLAPWIARHPDRCWVYPRVAGDALTFHAVTDPLTDLTTGAFGILEPVPSLVPVPIESIDAFLCPGLAFDAHGGRLGRGRGFYDRLLSRARPGALKIGVCFASQIVSDTFSEPHDVHMDIVISA